MTSELPAGLDVDFELTRFVRRVRARSLRSLGEIHPRLDYGSFTFLLLICDAPDGIRGSEIAEELGVHKSTASRAIASMEKLGLITRIPDPDDGRAHLLVARPETEARVAEYRRNSHERLLALLDDWTPEEVAVFARSLTRLNDRAETEF
ncbi:MarR family winged helix-turn-helix transcriptional regulator [Aeromicrobium chenweiae]|uniref:MarR family transcriptional regulator n=1 Tax=Aeromicrobium chenweiae TaxID=2079793 RepID=A0A2S0WLU5_9ACTN|nr:MarR family transcriptional regulator [Aeromicrobium chenweiae]AWB92240.1 MarR family transcriptional regulator [Aeromicrobium chenweiae]TGN31475.1 MarR family transcriptional regulator [Aeromicrobium chenweiae]